MLILWILALLVSLVAVPIVFMYSTYPVVWALTKYWPEYRDKYSWSYDDAILGVSPNFYLYIGLPLIFGIKPIEFIIEPPLWILIGLFAWAIFWLFSDAADRITCVQRSKEELRRMLEAPPRVLSPKEQRRKEISRQLKYDIPRSKSLQLGRVK